MTFLLLAADKNKANQISSLSLIARRQASSGVICGVHPVARHSTSLKGLVAV
jgi:hypothetical protein